MISQNKILFHFMKLDRFSESSPYSIRSIERALKVIDCFTTGKNLLTIGELACLTNLSKSTVFRILQTLEKHRFISHDYETNRYSLGMKLFELGGIVSSSFSLRKIASRFLDKLEKKINHTILMGILEDGELVYIDKREGKEDLKLTSEIGKRRPPYYGMLGKTLMAYLSENEIDNLLKKYPLKKVASRSITDPKKFKKSLKKIQKKGYTYEWSEAVEGVIGIAAPIRDHHGKVVSAIGVAIPKFNREKINKEEIIKLVLDTANEISKALGFSNSS